MSFFPKTYTINKEQPIVIRQAVSDDAAALLELKLSYIKNTTTLPLFDHEYPNSQEEEKQLIEKYQSDNNSLLLVATVDNAIVGNIDLTASFRKKMEHTAMIGMGIDTNWQNKGIGTVLLQNIIHWAKQNETLRLLWLEVYATNIGGIALYKKLNFIQAGEIPGFFIEKEAYVDKMIMYQKI